VVTTEATEANLGAVPYCTLREIERFFAYCHVEGLTRLSAHRREGRMLRANNETESRPELSSATTNEGGTARLQRPPQPNLSLPEALPPLLRRSQRVAPRIARTLFVALCVARHLTHL
jgi:hypothetical protein